MQGCGEIRVAPAKEIQMSLSTQGKICTDLPAELGANTKILFVVDKSGSNSTTDPSNVLRADSMRNLINLYRNNPRIYWGLIRFHNGGAVPMIQSSDSPPRYFVNDPDQALQSVSDFEGIGDIGDTPYLSALAQAKLAIENDLAANTEELAANYNIIFISDGKPMPESTNPDAQIMSTVQSIVALSRGSIHLSTIYYGPEDASANMRLQQMADLGTGIFQKAQQGVPLDLSRFILASQSNEPYLIKKFSVYNLNAGTCDDGTIGADSDADGLCDKDELRYNQLYKNDSVRGPRMIGKLFDPANRYSFDSHLSDGIFYRHIVYNEALPAGCGPADDEDEDMDLLNNCEERFLYNQNPQGPTTNWTDKMIQKGKSSDSQYFDTDGDGILDSIEFLFFKNKSTALNYNNLTDKTNGYDNEYLVQNHLNPMNPRSESAYNGSFTKVDPDSEGRNCYTYTQAALPLYATRGLASVNANGNYHLAHNENENVILISYIEVPEYAPNGKGFLRYSFQKMKKDLNGPRDLNLDTNLFDVFPR